MMVPNVLINPASILLAQIEVPFAVYLSEKGVSQVGNEPDTFSRRFHLWAQLLIDFREFFIGENRNFHGITIKLGLVRQIPQFHFSHHDFRRVIYVRLTDMLSQ